MAKSAMFMVLLLLLQASSSGSLALPAPARSESAAVAATPVDVPPPAVRQLLLGFAPGASEVARAAAIASRGGRLLRTFPQLDVALIALPPGGGAADFAVDPAVRYAAPNAPIIPARLPDEPTLAGGDLRRATRRVIPQTSVRAGLVGPPALRPQAGTRCETARCSA